MTDKTPEPNSSTPPNQEPIVMESALVVVDNLDKKSRTVDLDERSSL